jgi:multidrug transporter EmrE-like cation transporter
MKYLLTVVYIFFTTSGITFMKLGGDSLKLGLKDGFSLSMGWKTFVGFLFYLVSFILWQKLLVKYDLSVMVPIVTGISQIIIITIGYLVFKESFNLVTLVGALLIVVGIVVMIFSVK